MGILDHIGINVTDYARSKEFYSKALAPLGITLVMEWGQAAGFGRGGKPDFWIGQGQTSFQRDEHLAAITPIHVCFAATRAEVDAFHAAALAAGGRDFGAPGLRPHYHANYYGAFVLDPDGHNIEAACHLAPGAVKAAATAKKATRAPRKAKAAANEKPIAKKKAAKQKPAKKRARA